MPVSALDFTSAGQQTALDALLSILGASGEALAAPAGMLADITGRQRSILDTITPAATEGKLPLLTDPELTGRLDKIFGARELDIERFLDTALLDAITRARGMGFAGGLEIFREGTPANILAPSFAEATRQKGALAGQRAATEIDLAMGLPKAALEATALPAVTNMGLFNTLLGQAPTVANLFNQALIGQTGATVAAGNLQQRGTESFQNFLTNLLTTQRGQPSTTTTQTSSASLLDAFNSLAGTAGGVGSFLLPFALMSQGSGTFGR